MTTIGLLLAAGAGTRYGEPKILAHDGTWLTIAVRALQDGGCEKVLVVVGAARPAMPPGATAVVNEDWQSGMGSSLRVGLAESSAADRAVLHLVDTPDIGADVVQRVLAASTPTGLARASFDGRPGHPVVLARRWWSAAADAAVGDRGARDFLMGHRDVAVVECGDLASGRDHDYRELDGGIPTHADEFDRG